MGCLIMNLLTSACEAQSDAMCSVIFQFETSLRLGMIESIPQYACSCQCTWEFKMESSEVESNKYSRTVLKYNFEILALSILGDI